MLNGEWVMLDGMGQGEPRPIWGFHQAGPRVLKICFEYSRLGMSEYSKSSVLGSKYDPSQ